MSKDDDLVIWVIYDHPMDYPDKVVARKWIKDKPTDELIISDTLDGIRHQIPKGLFCISRDFYDDPSIIETWL